VTVPAQYVDASADFRKFLVELRDIAGLTTTNQAFTVLEEALMTGEVQGLRPRHKFASETSVRDVATVLRRNVDEADLDHVLGGLPEGARRFWRAAGQ
jgi:uncharacterized protein (DUF2267 family)